MTRYRRHSLKLTNENIHKLRHEAISFEYLIILLHRIMWQLRFASRVQRVIIFIRLDGTFLAIKSLQLDLIYAEI